MPLAHEVDDSLGHEGLAQSHLVCQKYTSMPQLLIYMEYAFSRGALKVFYALAHRRRICLMVVSNEAYSSAKWAGITALSAFSMMERIAAMRSGAV